MIIFIDSFYQEVLYLYNLYYHIHKTGNKVLLCLQVSGEYETIDVPLYPDFQSTPPFIQKIGHSRIIIIKVGTIYNVENRVPKVWSIQTRSRRLIFYSGSRLWLIVMGKEIFFDDLQISTKRNFLKLFQI